MSSLKIGVLGAAGQVGSALLKRLNKDPGLRAVGICRNKLSAARVACLGLDVRIAQTDDAPQLVHATQDLDILVNCALPQLGPSRTPPANERFAHALATACGNKLLVHLSSVAVYGNFISGEEALFGRPKPDSAYGRQKLHMETLLRRLTKDHSMKCTILRVGHVFGAELAWSELLIDLIRNDQFRLPFNGELSSNAISITNLGAAIRELAISKPASATFNLTNLPQTSWREIFDLHSKACDAVPVGSLERPDSERLFRQHKKWAATGTAGRILRESYTWGKQLPGSFVGSVPAFKDLTQWALESIGSYRLESNLWALYHKRFAPRNQPQGMEINPLFLSEQAPGPGLNYEAVGVDEELHRLREWHQAVSEPPGEPQLAIA